MTYRSLSPLLLAVAATGLVACDMDTDSTPLETRILELEGVVGVTIEDGPGRLEVLGDPTATEMVEDVTLETYTFQDAGDAEKDMTYTLEIMGDRAVLKVDIDETVGWADVKVWIPNSLPVEITDGSGDVEVRTVASLRLVDDSGEVAVRSVAGDLVIEDDSGDLDLTDIEGTVRITDDSGEIRLRDVGGAIEITDESGDLEVVDANETLRIHDGSGSIRVERVMGRVDIYDGSGDITLVDTPDAWVMSDKGGEVYRH